LRHQLPFSGQQLKEKSGRNNNEKYDTHTQKPQYSFIWGPGLRSSIDNVSSDYLSLSLTTPSEKSDDPSGSSKCLLSKRPPDTLSKLEQLRATAQNIESQKHQIS